MLSDLTAGMYEVEIDYLDETYTQEIEIHPGAVSYFHNSVVNSISIPLSPYSNH